MRRKATIMSIAALVSFRASAAIIAGDTQPGPGYAPPQNNTDPYGSANTTWDRVGEFGNGTAVYLGDGWVLTANHVSASSFVVSGQSYAVIGGTSTQIGTADLKVMRVDVAGSSLESLTQLKLSGTGPTVNSTGTHMGTGQTAVSQYSNSGIIWTWDDAAQREKNWDYQTVSTVSSSFNGTASFSTSFQDTLNYGAAVNHDSGSAYYSDTDNDGQLELAGVAISATLYDLTDAYDPTGTLRVSLYGNDVSTYADISVYADQITAAIPEPATMSIFGTGIFGLIGYRRRREWMDRLKQIFSRKEALEPAAPTLREHSRSPLGNLLLKLAPVRTGSPQVSPKADPIGDLLMKIDSLTRRL